MTKQNLLDYILTTPENINPAVLNQIIDEYVEEKMITQVILDGSEGVLKIADKTYSIVNTYDGSGTINENAVNPAISLSSTSHDVR